MFDGFDQIDVATEGTTIHARKGGSGPPLLLLHSFPQTHLMWHATAPTLAGIFTVVTADLRGYGDSLSLYPARRDADHADSPGRPLF
jgi:haloacetate dehalogenase